MPEKKDLKAILVAGGEGSRLNPFTKYTHKTLLPLFDRPVIDYALATIRRAGVKDITIIDDTYNANLTSSLAALDYLSAFSGNGRKIFVFGDMYELGPTTDKQHQKVGERCLELNLDGVFTIGEHTKHTNSIINNGMMSKHFMNKKDLIDSLQKIIESGDKVLFKGSRGMEMDKVIEGVFYT